jgi:hypothetical protein
MSKINITLPILLMLLLPAWSVAADKPTDTRPKPSSFVPHPHTNNHVYGAPIGPPVVGHSKTSHHKPPKKRSSIPKK